MLDTHLIEFRNGGMFFFTKVHSLYIHMTVSKIKIKDTKSHYQCQYKIKELINSLSMLQEYILF